MSTTSTSEHQMNADPLQTAQHYAYPPTAPPIIDRPSQPNQPRQSSRGLDVEMPDSRASPKTLDGAQQAVLALATLSVFLAGLDASLIAITVTLFSSGFGKPVSPRSRPIYVFANLALIFAILSATLYTTMFVSQPMRNSIWIRTASFTLIASALSFTFGEAVHIMILLLGNDESRVPAFGYVLPLAVAGLVSAILLLAWAWWFTYDFRWFCAHLCGDSGRGPAEQARRAQHFEGGFFGSQY